MYVPLPFPATCEMKNQTLERGGHATEKTAKRGFFGGSGSVYASVLLCPACVLIGLFWVVLACWPACALHLIAPRLQSERIAERGGVRPKGRTTRRDDSSCWGTNSRFFRGERVVFPVLKRQLKYLT